MASSHSKAYKYERRAEKLFKAKRIIDQSGGDADLINEWLVIEGFQEPIPEYLWKKIRQAVRASAKRGNKHLPIVYWREKGKRDKDGLIIVRVKDWIEWYI